MKASCLIIEQHRHHAEEIYRDIYELFEHFHIAVTAQEAMTYIKDHRFDMIIINPFFADSNGRTFIHDLKGIKKLSMTPIIVVSELPAAHVKLDFYSKGADAYIEMPYNKVDFFNMVREQLLRHFQLLSNNGRDKDSAFIPRNEFEQSYSEAQQEIRNSGSKGFIGLVAPAGIDFVIRDYGLERGVKFMTALSQLMQNMCSEKLRAAIWTQKSIVFIMPDKNEEEIKDSLNELRAEFLNRFSDIDKFQRTPGLRAVLTVLPADKSVHDMVDILSIQLSRISKLPDMDPVQVYGASVSMKRHVLIADPDPIAVNVIRHRLKQDGFEPEVFQEATDLVNHPHIDDIAAILIDSMIPGGGLDMIRKIHSRPEFSDKPIMLLSRYGYEEEIARAFQIGAQDYMMKPISMIELSARMKKLTG